MYPQRSSTTDAAAVARSIADAGVELGPSEISIRSLLDTFDGRLHRAGLRVEARSGRPAGPFELVVSDSGGGVAGVVVAGPIGALAELTGPVGERLNAVAPGRALDARATIVAPVRRGAVRDAQGNTVAVVDVFGDGRWVAGGLADQRRGGSPSPVAVELRLLVDRRKPIKDLARELTSIGGELVAGDLLDQALGACGVDPAGLDTTPSIELAADLPAGEGVRRLLVHLTGTIDATWRGTAEARDIEYLHEFRIAVRRTRTVLSACRGVLPDALVAHGRTLFSYLSELTGPARDLDVTVVDWPTLISGVEAEHRDALEPLRSLLEGRRDDAHRGLTAGLRAAPTRRRMEAWRVGLAADAAVEGVGTAGMEIEERIRRAHRRLVSHGREITNESVAEQLHELRKDAKKLRYLVECFAGLVRSKPRRRFVARLKRLQDVLGEFQDSEVQAAMLRESADELRTRGASIETLRSIDHLAAVLDDRRGAARSVFAERFDDFDSDDVHALFDDLFKDDAA